MPKLFVVATPIGNLNDLTPRMREAIENADLLIVGGTSLAVYPAAGLLRYYRGNRLVLINLTETPYDNRADLIIHGRIGEVLGQIRV